MREPIRFGVFDQTEQPGNLSAIELFESRLALAELAERLGFARYHKSEHHLTPLDHAPSIGLFLAALAQRTRTMRLGSLCHLLPFYHPLRLYEEICMLDALSHGRFEFGFGKGISAPEHRLWGLDPDEATARTEETFELLMSAFRCEGDFSFEGRFHRFADVPLQIRPTQRPHPPLWRPGRTDIAAHMGASTLAGGPTSAVHEAIERFDAIRQSLGPAPGPEQPQIGALRRFIVAPTDDEAMALGRSAWARLTNDLGMLFRAYDEPIPNDPTVGGDFDRALSVQAAVVGSPATVRAHIDELTASGKVRYVVGCFAFGDLTHEQIVRSMSLFGEHVIAPLSGR
ncbi:MAG: LLM class flavin-dependent oxidoreductase [Burkholderiaceae bacterium]